MFNEGACLRWLITILALLPLGATAQTSDSSDTPSIMEQTVIDASPFVSPRSQAMGGAMGPVADDLEATFANPAGIGGWNMGKRRLPSVRKLYFPHMSAAANENTKSLNKAFKEQGGTDDPAVGQSILDAAQGDRQYARANAILGLVWSRTIFVPFYDYQAAAVSQGDGLVDTHYRAMSGAGMGFSLSDNNHRFSFGYFSYTADIKDLRGQLNYIEFIDTEARKSAFDRYTNSYSGTGHNAGLLWRIHDKMSPTLSIAMVDVGDTIFESTGELAEVAQPSEVENEDVPPNSTPTATVSEFEIDEQIKYDENLTIGFSITPELSNNAHINVVAEMTQVENGKLNPANKFRLGLEYNLYGGTGSYATMSLRAGYNHAGTSAGAYLNLGIINFEASTYAVDIGMNGNKVVEQRIAGSVGINVGEF